MVVYVTTSEATSQNQVSEAIETEARLYDIEEGLGWPNTRDEVIETIQERVEVRHGVEVSWHQVAVGVQSYINQEG